MGWLIALAVFLLIALLPIGAMVRYDSRGFLVRIIAGCFRFTIYPMKKRKKKPEKKAEKKQKPAERLPPAEGLPKEQKEEAPPKIQSAKQSDEKPTGGNFRDFLPFVRVVLNFMNQFRKKMRIDYLQLKLILAGEDPCDLAVNYGRAWAAMGNLLPMLERLFTIKKRDCEVECDFTAGETLVIARMDVTLRVWQAVSLGAVYGFHLIKELLIFKKKRKGGAVS